MGRVKLLAIILIVLVFIVVLITNRLPFMSHSASIAPAVTQSSSLQKYTNTTYKYSFQYPQDVSLVEAVAPPSRYDPNSDNYTLDSGELQKVTVKKGHTLGACSITVLPNLQHSTLAQWAQSYHVDAAGGDNLAKIIGDTHLGQVPAKEFSIFLFDHSDSAVAVAYNDYIYFVRYIKSIGNSNFDSEPDMREAETICKNLLKTFTFLQ